MATVSNTELTFSMKGIREDLSDVIYNISPVETPFMTSIGRAKADNTFHEWQTQSLAAADTTNAQLEGDDITSFQAANFTTRLGNYTQISRKTVIVSGTADAVKKAGRKSELALQVAIRGKELKRDIESILCGTNQARTAGNSTTARTLASTLSWIKTNTDLGASGADPSASDGTGTRTDGTTRVFVGSSLKTVLKSIWTNSGDEPEMLMVGGTVKQEASTFAGNTTRMQDTTNKKLVASIDYYTGDFSSVRIVPNRFVRSRDAQVINTDLWAVAWLRPIKLEDLAKTGDASKKQLIGEYTLESRNEAGSGIIADLQ